MTMPSRPPRIDRRTFLENTTAAAQTSPFTRSRCRLATVTPAMPPIEWGPTSSARTWRGTVPKSWRVESKSFSADEGCPSAIVVIHSRTDSADRVCRIVWPPDSGGIPLLSMLCGAGM